MNRQVQVPSDEDVRGIAGSGERLFGANKLELITDKNLRQQVSDGDGTVNINITNTRGQSIYTVREWRSHPEAETGTPSSFTLAASLECGGDQTNRKVLDISRIDSLEQRASVACSGSLQAEIRSVRDPDGLRIRICCCKVTLWNTVTGALLRRALYVEKSKEQGLKYAAQAYTLIISLERLVLEGLVSGPPLKQLQVTGTKTDESIYYECCVKGSKEVLATYRHGLPQPHHGVIVLLGIANHASLREIIVSTFVAMGLAKDL